VSDGQQITVASRTPMREPDGHTNQHGAARSASFFASTNLMTSGSVETDEKPFPLDSRWVAQLSLAAESHNVPLVFWRGR